MALSLLASAKRVGMSFEEVNMLTMVELLDLFHEYIGDNGETRRAASQDDIDRLFA